METGKPSTIPYNRLLELETLDLNEWTEQEILQVVSTQFGYAQQTWLNKKNDWLRFIKLYLNAERRQIADIQLGSKLLFTQFHETYSSIDNDKRRVLFKERRPQDKEIVVYTNAVAEFDFEEMNMPLINRELNWNIIFFGTGLLYVGNFNKARKVLEPEVQSPFLFLIDPKAVNIESARFAGRFIYRTFYDLLNDSNLDPEQVKEWARMSPTFSGSEEQIRFEQEAKRILMGDNYYTEPITVGTFFEILEWYFYANGKLWVVWTDNGITRVLGYKKLDFQDKGDRESKIPFVAYHFIKHPFGFWGLGLPEIIEDNHRADVVLKNYLLKAAITDATPSYFINYEALVNPKDLVTKEINKVIFTKVPPGGQIVPFPKTQAISNDTLAFMNIIQNEAVGAIGSSRILKGSLTQVKKTATEIAIAKAKQDLQISSIMRNIIAGEKDFWYRWLRRYKRFLKDDDEKLVELIGFAGAKKFTSVKKRQFIPEIDPAVEVVSSLEAEPEKIMRRRELAELIEPLAQLGGNVREVIRTILYDMDLTPEQVDIYLPPTPHELRAREENKLLEEGIMPEIHENDEDLVHIAEHYKVEESVVRNLHIQAHIMNYLRKQGIEMEKKGRKKEEISVNLSEAGLPSDVLREIAQLATKQEGIMPLREAIEPSTPSEVK